MTDLTGEIFGKAQAAPSEPDLTTQIFGKPAPAPVAPAPDPWALQKQQTNVSAASGNAWNQNAENSALGGWDAGWGDLLHTIGRTGEMIQSAVGIGHPKNGVPEMISGSADWWQQQAAIHEHNLQKSHASALQQLPGQVIGSFAPGMMEWQAGAIFSTIQGYENNPDHPIRSAAVGFASREAQGAMMHLPVGRLLMGIGFAGITAAQGMANGQPVSMSNLIVSGVIGALNGKRMSAPDAKSIETAKAALAAGKDDVAINAISALSPEAKAVIQKAAHRSAETVYMTPEMRAWMVDHPGLVTGNPKADVIGLTHFGKPGLTEVDPAFMGSNPAIHGEEHAVQNRQQPFSMWYEQGDTPRLPEQGLGPAQYTTAIDRNSIIDNANHPEDAALWAKHSNAYKAEQMASGKFSDPGLIPRGPMADEVMSRMAKEINPRTGQPYQGFKSGDAIGLFNKQWVASLGERMVRKDAPMVTQALYAIHNGGGATLNLARGQDMSGKDAYSVAIYPERSVVLDHAPTSDEVRDFITRNKDLLDDPRNNLGLWHDAESGQTYMDVSALVGDTNKAVILGRKYDQKAVWHLGRMEEVATGGSGNPGSFPTPERERADAEGITAEEPKDYVEPPLPTPKTAKGIRDTARNVIISRYAQAQQHSQISARLDGFASYMDQFDPDEQAAMAKEYIDTGTIDKNPEAASMFAINREVMDRQAQFEKNVAGLDYELRDNYLPSLVKSGPSGEEMKGGGPLSGKPGFMKGKVFADPVELIAAGYTPVSTNPGTLGMLRVAYGSLASARIAAYDDFVKTGVATQDSGQAPQGWVPAIAGGKRYLVSPVAQKVADQLLPRSLAMSGLTESGQRWHDIGMSAFRKVMKLKAITTISTLSLSTFHLLHETHITVADGIGNSLDAVAHGKTDNLSAHGAFHPAKNAETGWKALHIWEKPHDEQTPEERTMTDLFISGGYVPGRPEIYDPGRTRITVESALEENMSPMRRMGGLAGQVADFVQNSASKIQEPLFAEYIPSLKANAYLMRAMHEINLDPTLLGDKPEDSVRLRAALSKAGDDIDFRYGELQYNRIAWNRIVKRALFTTFLSVGWNWGFLHQFVGGAGDIGKASVGNLMNMALKNPARYGITNRAIYSTSYLLLGAVLTGAMSYLNTGKDPGVKGTFYVATPDGKYLSTPFFNREYSGAYYHVRNQGVFHGATAIVLDKLAPIWEPTYELVENKSFYGEQIYDPDADLPTQLMQAGTFYGTAFMPISMAPMEEPGSTPQKVAVSALGLNPAAAYVSKPEMLQDIQGMYESAHSGTTPYGSVESRQAYSTMSQLYQQGKAAGKPFEDAMVKYLTAHPKSSVAHVMAQLREPVGSAEFSKLTPDQQVHIYQKYGTSAIQFWPFTNHAVRPQILQILEKDGLK